ncbi:MAG: DNA polymerase III subunit delta' [Candidatus Rokubacteria bacterium]|nr:DNA polymerase III subunit delta' [Candidatus Rokubacteria bacterium]
MAFDAVRGQPAAVDVLTRALASGRVAHAYAFVGPPGVGRKLTAVEFAKALLCPHPMPLTSSPLPGGEKQGEGGMVRVNACGSCPACRRVEAGTHPDYMLIAPTPPEGRTSGTLLIRIEAIRQLEQRAALRPAEGAWKVFIVDDAGRMTPEAPQAFLKTLEEPPAHTVIILILAHARELPATVLSRCQVVRFMPLREEEAVALLQARGMDEDTARLLARASQGRPGVALAQDPAAWLERRELALAILAEVGADGAAAIFKWGETLGRDRARMEQLIETWWLWHRDLLCAKAGGDPRLLLHGDRAAELTRQAAARSWEGLVEGLAACRDAWQALQRNVTPRLTLEVMLSRLALGAA